MKGPDQRHSIGLFLRRIFLLLLLLVVERSNGGDSSSWDSFHPGLTDILGKSSSGRQKVLRAVKGVSPADGTIHESGSSTVVDAFARSITLSLGLIVSLQAGCNAIHSHRHRLIEVCT